MVAQPNDYYETLLIQGILDLSAGDTVNHYGRQDSGGNLNVGATDQFALQKQTFCNEAPFRACCFETKIPNSMDRI